jgi:hypothetical protein
MACSLFTMATHAVWTCYLTDSKACSKGGSIPGSCPYPPGGTWTYTETAGNNLNFCVPNDYNGYAGCVNESTQDCVINFSYSGCKTSSGSYTNKMVPQHAAGSNYWCRGVQP